MNLMGITKTLGMVGKAARKYTPTILSVAGAAGVVATGVSAAKAGYNDRVLDESFVDTEPKNDRVKRKIRTYAKPVIFGAASIGCILAGDRIHAKRYAALGAAASVIQDRYDRLSKQLRMSKIANRDEDGNLIEGKAGAADAGLRGDMDANEAERIYLQCQEAGIHPYDTHSGNDLWYESFSKTWFFASEKHVDDAGYNLNRNFHLRGESPFSEYLRFLELPVGDHPMYDKFHWNLYEGEVYYGYSWVDFMYAKKRLANGLEYTQIFYPFEPHLGEE